MRPDSEARGSKKGARALRIFAPFTMLLIALGIINLRVNDIMLQHQSTGAVATPTSSTPGQSTSNGTVMASDNLEIFIATAIPHATEPSTKSTIITPSPVPTLVPGEVASLLGPPPRSHFSLTTPVAFYWNSTLDLNEDQVLALFVVGPNDATLVSELSKANLGSAFEAHLIPEVIGLSAGDYYWQVRLMQGPENIVLGVSEERPIRLISTPE